MTFWPAACRRPMTPAFRPFGQVTGRKPGTFTTVLAGTASCRSMSYIVTLRNGSVTFPVICHCHVVPSAGDQYAVAPRTGGSCGPPAAEAVAEATIAEDRKVAHPIRVTYPKTERLIAAGT